RKCNSSPRCRAHRNTLRDPNLFDRDDEQELPNGRHHLPTISATEAIPARRGSYEFVRLVTSLAPRKYDPAAIALTSNMRSKILIAMVQTLVAPESARMMALVPARSVPVALVGHAIVTIGNLSRRPRRPITSG